jgi:hypothetical protein
MDEKNNQLKSLPPKGKLVTAGIIFVAGFLSPLLIPLVTSSDLSTGWKAALSGFLALGIPELFMMIAAAVAGKEGFNYIKSKVFGLLKKHGPADTVSKTRYRIGLVLFLIPIIVGWLLPYFTHLIPSYEENRNIISVVGDVVLITSLFVLGGDFWDKLRSLFVYGAKAIFPDKKKSTDKEN